MRSMNAFLVALFSAVLLSGCASQHSQSSELYDQLGAADGIEQLVDQLIVEIAADDRIRHHFVDIHIAGFRERLESHFCTIAGGPCEYSERTMQDAHSTLGIDRAAFNALVEDLMLAMDSLDIAYATQNQFLAQLVPMREDIVVR